MVAGFLRRARRRRIDPDSLVPLPDSHPKRGLIAEPVRVARLEHSGVETAADSPTEVPEGSVRVTFLVEVRSADDARCPAVAVEAVVAGPERSRTVVGTTDLMGRVRFRMTGPAGDYSCEITDVAAGGLDWARDAGSDRLAVECR